jgi:AraC-like DNA-binding protein
MNEMDVIEPGFSPWTVLLSVIALVGLVLMVLFARGTSRLARGERWLALLMGATSVTMCSYVLYWTHYNTQFPYLNNIWPFLTFLVGPSLYFYVRAVFKVESSRRDYLLHFSLPVLVGLCSLPVLLNNVGVDLEASRNWYIIGTNKEMLIAHLVTYTFLVHRIVQNDWQVDDNLKAWSRIIVKGLVAYTIGFLSYFILVNATFFSVEWDYAISLVMSAGILTIAYMGFWQKPVFAGKPVQDLLPGQKYATSMLTEGAKSAIQKKMVYFLEEEKVFKENELRLDDLAAYLDVNRHQLSQVINEHYQVNFFELINGYRVRYVQELLRHPEYEHYTIQQLAFESGFNNKASFNRYFKKETGLTPSAYRLREKQKRVKG